MASISLMAKHYDLIFDESQPTYLFQLRKNAVDKLLPLMIAWENGGAEPFMVSDMFEPFLEEIGSVQSEDEIQGIIDRIEKLKNE